MLCLFINTVKRGWSILDLFGKCAIGEHHLRRDPADRHIHCIHEIKAIRERRTVRRSHHHRWLQMSEPFRQWISVGGGKAQIKREVLPKMIVKIKRELVPKFWYESISDRRLKRTRGDRKSTRLNSSH